MPDEGRDRGTLVVDVHVEKLGTGQVVVGKGVDADSQTMGTQSRILLGSGLDDVEACEVAVLVDVVVRADGVDTGGAQPLLGEGGQVPPGRHLELVEKVFEFGV